MSLLLLASISLCGSLPNNKTLFIFKMSQNRKEVSTRIRTFRMVDLSHVQQWCVAPHTSATRQHYGEACLKHTVCLPKNSRPLAPIIYSPSVSFCDRQIHLQNVLMQTFQLYLASVLFNAGIQYVNPLVYISPENIFYNVYSTQYLH